MIAAFDDEELDAIARDGVKRLTLQTDNARNDYDQLQINLKRRTLSSM
uniref:Uncharacterized protein n=1 Tax=Peronospora matthiolae TaxID=2874970 RepID=A0AAV1VEK3_9STRA